MSRRPRGMTDGGVPLVETLVAAGLAPPLARLLEQLPHSIVRMDPRRTYREPGAGAEEVMFVRSGIIAKFKSAAPGRRQIVALRFAGDGVLPRNSPSSYGIQAIVRSEVLVGNAEDFSTIVRAHPDLASFFLKLTQRHAAIADEWLLNCGRRDAMARVAHFLCEVAVRTGMQTERMANPFTQQQIADITGQTSVNVNRVFAEMERKGLIRREGREIDICNWKELTQAGSFTPDYLA